MNIAEAAEKAANASSGIHIKLSAERLGEVFGIPITNTLLTTWAVMILLTLLAIFIKNRISMTPGRIQILFEEMITFILNYMEEVLEDKRLAKKLFPLIATIFIFIFTANILEFVPGIGSVGIVSYDASGAETGFTSLFRSVNTDLNVTLALAIISFVIIEMIGITKLGALTYLKKFINFSSPINFVVGIIELFSELARLVSFSFRLFGNILAGKVLIIVIIFFVPYFLPVPIMLFEVFVGFIQAAIFALLTLFFVKIAITKPH